jgi:hypothetical protein
MQLRAFAACAAACCTLLTTQPCLTAAAEPPSAEAQATLRRGYQAVSTGLLPTADSLLTQSINEWQRTGQPPDELSALFKSRSGVRKQQGKLDAALADLDEAVRLLTQGGDARADPAEVQRTFVLRARVNAETRRWKEAEVGRHATLVLLAHVALHHLAVPRLRRPISPARLHASTSSTPSSRPTRSSTRSARLSVRASGNTAAQPTTRSRRPSSFATLAYLPLRSERMSEASVAL